MYVGMKRIVPFVLYGVLVLLLLILLMVTGIKCTSSNTLHENEAGLFIYCYMLIIMLLFSYFKVSQLNKEVTDVKLNLERISNGKKTSSSGSGEEKVFQGLDKLMNPCNQSIQLLLFFVASLTEGRTVVQEVPLQQREPVRGKK